VYILAIIFSSSFSPAPIRNYKFFSPRRLHPSCPITDYLSISSLAKYFSIKLGRKTTSIVPHRPNHDGKWRSPYIFGFINYYYAIENRRTLPLPSWEKFSLACGRFPNN
jgi:hypothetical protein